MWRGGVELSCSMGLKKQSFPTSPEGGLSVEACDQIHHSVNILLFLI